MVQWFQRMNDNSGGFRDVMIAMVSYMNKFRPSWLHDSIVDPMAEMPRISVVELVGEMETLAGDNNTSGEELEKKVTQLEKQLAGWRI